MAMKIELFSSPEFADDDVKRTATLEISDDASANEILEAFVDIMRFDTYTEFTVKKVMAEYLGINPDRLEDARKAFPISKETYVRE